MIRENIKNHLFGHYQIISKLAEYPLHTTYLATQNEQISRSGQMQSTGEPVVLKVWHSTLNQQLFIQHIHLLRRLRHPHIVAILDAGIEQDMPYLVSSYAARESLRERLQRQAPYPLSVAEAVTIITHLGQAIVYAHKNNVLHGAIKPENIVFNEHNEVQFTDFRVAPDTHAVPYNDIFTYMAPEQLNGQTTRKSDQFALACVAYELLTGCIPFARANSAEQQQQLTKPSLPLRQLQPTLPTYIEQAILRAMSLRAEFRFPSIDKFVQALQATPDDIPESEEATSSLFNPVQQLLLRPQPLAATTSQDNTSAQQHLVPVADIQPEQAIAPAPIAVVPATALLLSLSPKATAAPVETHTALTIPMRYKSMVSPLLQKPQKSVLLGLACVACIVVLTTAGILSLLKMHTSSTPQPNDGAINILVNTQPGKPHTSQTTPPRIQHFAVTPTMVPTHVKSKTTQATGNGVAMFNATHLPPSDTIDLTNEGQIDWVQWGMNGPGSVNRKAGVSSQIGSYSIIKGGMLRPYSNNAINYTWSDGTPNGNIQSTNSGVGMSGSGNGFQLTIPAATTARTLRVYIGVLHAQANFTAALSEKSSMIYSDTAQSDSNDMKNIMYVIHFEASSSTQYLTIKLIVRYSYNGGMVTLQAATLQ